MRGKLSNILNPGDCISEEMMLEYMAGKLKPQDRHRVEKHLLECEICSDAFEGLSMQSSQPVNAIMEELDDRIDKRISRGQEKIRAPQWFYRIAAVLVVGALFMGGLYYLQSVKKSEKVFTENFEPYRDTVHPASPVASVPALQDETVKEGKEKFVTALKRAEQKSEDKETKDISSRDVSQVQTTTTEKNSAGEIAVQSRNTDEDYKKEEKPNSIPETAASGAKPVADAESGTKKMESDKSQNGDALAKTSQPPKPLLRETATTKSNRKDDQAQVQEATAPSYNATTIIGDNEGSGRNELINEGMRQYEAKNYTAAVSVLHQALDKQPGNADALFYSGVSNLSLNEDRVAIKQLESVLTNSPNKFSDAAKWYLSLAYVKKNKIAKAKKLLKDLSLGNSEYKSIAQKTLDELK